MNIESDKYSMKLTRNVLVLETKIFKISLVIISALVLVYGSKGNQCGNLKQTFHAAENRELQTYTFWEGIVNSPIRCVSYCHADDNCLSVNYHQTDLICALNNGTKDEYSDDFITHFGSVYYDADVDTPLLSVPRYSDCKQLLEADHTESGIYTIVPTGFSSEGLKVYCDMETDGGGWIVIQRRQDGSVDFFRNWTDYQVGFGNLSGEFWLGNDNLRILTESVQTWQLHIDLEDWENNTAWAEYEGFQIHGDNYILEVNSYNTNSTAGDSLMYHDGMMFSTKDKDNDIKSNGQCATQYLAGWWYNWCYESNLNGKLQQGTALQGIVWRSWKNSYYNINKCSMKIQPFL